MAASFEDWSCDSNQAVRVSLTRTDPSQPKSQSLHQFHPKFTYPIFGTEERIFGYQGLNIEVQFAAHDCRPRVLMSYDKKFNKVGDVKPDDCWSTLQEFMPPPAFSNTFEDEMFNDTQAREWSPPGRKVHSYKRNGRSFEIWSGPLSDISVRNQLDQVQILVLFFIEGGSMINLDDPEWTLDRWEVYFIYEKTQAPDHPNISPYVLAGYATTYRCYTLIPPNPRPSKTSLTSFPHIEPINLTRQTCRLRISQVVVLPPFQASGHGTELYQTVYRHVMADETVRELTVEDPSEEFDKLRDVNDWKVLEPAFRNADININTSAVAKQSRYDRMPKKRLLDMKQLENIRKSHKIAPRQFYRCMELYFLAQIPFSHRAAGGASLTKLLIKKHKSSDPIDVKYYWLRNLIKERIWFQNNDKFSDTPKTEIVDSINDVTRGQEDEYEGLLLRFAAKAAGELNGGSVGGTLTGGAARKRKIIDDDDDDEGAASDASKKARNSK